MIASGSSSDGLETEFGLRATAARTNRRRLFKKGRRRPFFGIWPDGFPYVIGTVSGGEAITGGGQDEDNNICAGGQALSDLINYWRTNWP